MKTLISVNEIKSLASAGKKVLYVEPGTIITPAARDAAGEWGIVIKFGLEPQEQVKEPENVSDPVLQTVSPELISKIVMEVMANLPQCHPTEIVKEVDSSGIRLVRGNSVRCESFNTGNPKDKVGIKEILTIKESPNMCTGFMTLDKTSFDWHLMYEEIDYIVEGTLDITINGKTYRGKAGDVFYIPADSKITFSSSDQVKFFFVTYPANWSELSGYKK